jgi:MFS superfamily sulfate permease-like transporter
MEYLRRVFPLIGMLAGYTREEFKKDAVAGVTTAVMLVPQGMA